MTNDTLTNKATTTALDNAEAAEFLRQEIQSALKEYSTKLGDLCDQGDCNSIAFMFAAKNSLIPELMFCGHHGRKSQDALTQQGFVFEDRTSALPTRMEVN